jgi:hypothetical protein
MAVPRVYFVHLRRPGVNDPRTDPMYEFGSFGCTKCHSKNLLHPRHAEKLNGARLAFVQGGNRGHRLVFLTPPITVKLWPSNCEARWTPAEMPFKYTEAPLLASKEGRSNFPLVKKFASRTHRPTLVSGFSSRVRSRTQPLKPPALANEVISKYERYRREKPRSAIASAYYEALPYCPKRVDYNRKNTYRRLIRKLRAESDDRQKSSHAEVVPSKTTNISRCGSSRRRQSERRTSRCI